MKQLQDLMRDILTNGQVRQTRSGEVISVFRRESSHDMRTGYPAVTTKKLAFKSMVGEGLWFMNGDTDLPSLRHYSCLSEDSNTIWTGDNTRWHSQGNGSDLSPEDLGKLYGHQWRNFGGDELTQGVDQISNLIANMINSPESRYLIVQAYDPLEVSLCSMALPPCHTGFQVYVDIETGEFDLNWIQR